MKISFEGPNTGSGTVWIDNFRVYELTEGLRRHSPADRAAYQASGMRGIRTHDTCKTQGYSLENLLGHPDQGLNSGRDVFSRGNLSTLLREFKEMNVFPWLQIEFTLSEQDWRNLIEYIAAPYDPLTDTPLTKPWAYRRVQHGQSEPYTSAFPRMLFEFSNENWNPIMPFHLSGVDMTDEATGQIHTSGAVYGMLQEYTIQTMKSSPYWTEEMDNASEFVLGGWSVNNFGYDAARMSSSSTHNLVADYNGGWDAGEGPETVGDLDTALRKTLIFGVQHSLLSAVRLREVRDQFQAETGIRTELGTYEAGPGYNIDGLNGVHMTMEMVEFENQAMKSLSAGTSTLDCFLYQATQGAKLQNFFTFSRNRNYWTSHADFRNGGQAYPSWLALSLYNNYGQGDFLAVLTESVPTRNAPAVGYRAAMPNAPEVGVFSTRSGNNLAVFVISRSLDAHIPVTLRLPITAAQSVTLHKLTGDPRANNLDAENVALAQSTLSPSLVASDFPVDLACGASAEGMPPASVFLYVFENATFAASAPSAFIAPAPGQTSPATDLPLRFRVSFSQAPASFTAANIQLGGSADPQAFTITPIASSYGREFEVAVTEVLDEGLVTVQLQNLLTSGGQAIPQASGELALAFPVGTVLPLLAWDFSALQDPENRDWNGQPINPSRLFPLVGSTTLRASHPNLLGDNGYYNDDGAGGEISGVDIGNGTRYFAFDLIPAPGRELDISRVDAGFWASADLLPRLEIWRNGSKIASVPFEAATAINNGGYLYSTAGILAAATTSSIPELHPLTEPVELRIVLVGQEATSGIFGIGKLGVGVNDLVVYGRTADDSPPLIISTTLPPAALGVPYLATLVRQGGRVPHTWSVSSGQLPAGLSLDPSTGVISGTPSSVGTSSVDITLTDSSEPPLAFTRSLSLTVNPAMDAPTFGTSAGTYIGSITLSLASASPGASIRFTTDGSDPTSTTGTLYSAPFVVSSSATLRAIAYRSGYADSPVTSATYTITVGPAQAGPTFGTPAGSYASPITLSLATTSPGASIRYTTDGSDPTSTTGTLYTAPFVLSGSATLRAIAYRNGYADGPVTTAAYTITGGSGGSGAYQAVNSTQPGGPVFTWHDTTTAAGGTKLWGTSDMDDDNADITFPAGFTFPFYGTTYSSIRVCSNGFISPTSTDTQYNPVALPSSSSTTPKPIIAGYWTDLYLVANSSSVTWKRIDDDTFVITFDKARRYSSNSDATYFVTFQFVLHRSGSIVIQYKDQKYNNPFYGIGIQNQTGTVALQVSYNTYYLPMGDNVNYAVQIAQGTNAAAAPTVTPHPGTYENSMELALVSATPDAAIRYTLDGTTPTASTGTLYTAPFTVSTPGAFTLKTLTTATGMDPSAVISFNYTILANPYEAWLATAPAYAGLNEAQRDPEADPFGTGVKNLLVYALALDPQAPALPPAEVADVSGTSRLRFTFTPDVVAGLTYTIEASSDLSDWSDASDITSSLTPGQPFTFTDSADLGTATKRFLRLRVALP